jgi:autotransporter-associated beta strand protein
MTSISKVGFGGFAVLLSVLLLGLSPVYADLAHRYDFEVDGSDTVGTADGTLVGSATITGGALVTNGNNGAINGQWDVGNARLTLDPSAVSGLSGAFAIETWFTCTTGWPKFDTLFAFSDDTTSNYMLGAPVRGYDPWPSGVGMQGAGGSLTGDQTVLGQWMDQGGPHQMVLTYDGTTFSLYTDGALADYSGLPSTLVNPGFNLSTLTYIGLNGGSPWPDPVLTGSTFDFRIYNSSFGATQVAALYGLGSDATNSAINAALALPDNLWYVDADGTWNTPTSWYSGAVPGANEDVTFGDIITADRTVTLDVSPSVNSLVFQNGSDGDYFIVPSTSETLTLTGDATVNTILGRHWLRAEIAGTAGLHATGPGELVLDADNSFSGGVTVQSTNLSVVNTDAIPAGNAIVLQNNGDLRFFGAENGFFHDDHGSPGFGTGTISSSVSVASGSILAVWDGADLTQVR